MRRVVVYVMLSLDGVADTIDQFFQWDEASDAQMVELISTQDAVILGRKTFDEWSGFWPTSDIEPFASFINGVQKYVATSTPLGEWSNSTAIEGDLLEFVRDLKQQDGGDIGVHASLSVIRSLLAGGVIDELGFAISPVIMGGNKLFDGLPRIELEPISIEQSPSGTVLASYRVKH